MSAGNYAYINAKVGALRSKMLTQADYRSLIEVSTAHDMFSLLKNTAYGKEIAKIKDYNLLEVERVLNSFLMDEHERIIYGMIGNPGQLLAHLYSKYDASLLKEALTLKAAGFDIEELSKLMPTKKISQALLDRIGEAKDIREAVEVLKDTEYYKGLNNALQAYNETGLIYTLTLAIDRHMYQRLWVILKKLTGRDRISAKELIGTEIDIINIISALRLRNYEGDIKELLIPVRFRANDEVLYSLSRVKSLSQLSSEVPKFAYWKVIEGAIKNRDAIASSLPLQKAGGGNVESLLPVEYELERLLVDKNRKMFYGDRFHIGVPLAHIYLKGIEIRNIISAFKLKEAKVENVKIEKFLILPL
ncbi:MAG TPA: hypothetical protein ENI78_02780 [Euryarchaeota archaeon]|nr:hypothetical protein [Euryarchaeota archaeon]